MAGEPSLAAARVVRQRIARNHKPPYAMERAANIHDEETARRHGFAGALVTGAVVGAYSMPTLIKRWGKDWLERGAFNVSFRRPVYDHQLLDIEIDFGRDETGETAGIAISHEGSVVVGGGAGLPDALPDLPLDRLSGPALPIPDSPPLATPEALKIGQTLGSSPLTLDAETLAAYIDRLDLAPGEWPADRVHPFIYMNVASIHQVSSLTFPTPGVHAASELQIISPAQLGETIETVGFISDLYERNGHHYFRSEQLVRTLDGRPVAFNRNRVVYRNRNAEAK